MRKFRNRRRLLGALACGLLALGGAWLPAEAGNNQPKKCDEPSARGNENSRKNCPEPTTTTSSTSTTSTSTTSTSTTSTSTTTTTTAPPTLDDTINDTLDEQLGRTTELPDLVPDVTETYVDFTFTLDEASQTFVPHPTLYFDTWAKNLGPVALDLITEDATNVENPPVAQCVAWSDRLCRARQRVGGFVVHPTHGHMHFDDFALYELRHLDAGGSPDLSSAGLISTSDKVSFCLVDSRRVRDDAQSIGTYPACNAVREGISAGWSDIYGSTLDGQQLNIEGLPDGRYGVVVSMNPSANVFESDYTNNRVAAIVELSGMNTETPTATLIERRSA